MIKEVNLKHSQYYGIKCDKFYKRLPANVKKRVLDSCLYNEINNMHYFFNDYNLRYNASMNI